MVGDGVIIVGHGCWCNYNRPWLVLIVGVIIVGHGWCWCNYSRPCLVMV